MDATLYYRHVVVPAMELYDELYGIPYDKNTLAAQVIAVAYQESNLSARRQYGGGPASGFLQYEKLGVLYDTIVRRNGRHIGTVLNIGTNKLDNKEIAEQMHIAIEHNDILGVLIMIDKYILDHIPLQPEDTYEQRWQFYLRTWRPGKPRRHDWDNCCQIAKKAIKHGMKGPLA